MTQMGRFGTVCVCVRACVCVCERGREGEYKLTGEVKSNTKSEIKSTNWWTDSQIKR